MDKKSSAFEEELVIILNLYLRNLALFWGDSNFSLNK